MNTGHLAQIPFCLTTLRLALAPTVALLAISGRRGWPMIICLLVALFTDIYDGILARRLGVETEMLRRYDSIADTIFYLGVGFAIWKLFPDVVRNNWLLLAILIALELLRYAFDWLKFRREASYHMWSSKAWGLLLAAAAIALLGFGYSSWLFRAAIILGIICDLEGLLISIVLPTWTHNVKSFVHAINLRQTAGTAE
jgi:CDP-diacylglycerol--glycerol-3-phosphate 3-phosphatidyltransferase